MCWVKEAWHKKARTGGKQSRIESWELGDPPGQAPTVRVVLLQPRRVGVQHQPPAELALAGLERLDQPGVDLWGVVRVCACVYVCVELKGGVGWVGLGADGPDQVDDTCRGVLHLAQLPSAHPEGSPHRGRGGGRRDGGGEVRRVTPGAEGPEEAHTCVAPSLGSILPKSCPHSKAYRTRAP